MYVWQGGDGDWPGCLSFCKAGPALLGNIDDTTQISECLNVQSLRISLALVRSVTFLVRTLGLWFLSFIHLDSVWSGRYKKRRNDREVQRHLLGRGVRNSDVHGLV